MAAKLPDAPFVKLLFFLLGTLAWYLGAKQVNMPVREKLELNEYLDIKNINFPYTEKIEDSWWQDLGAGPEYFSTALAPLPCPEGLSGEVATQVGKILKTAGIDSVNSNMATSSQLSQAIRQLKPLTIPGTAHWLPVLTRSILLAQVGDIKGATDGLDNFFANPSNQSNIDTLYNAAKVKNLAVTVAGQRVPVSAASRDELFAAFVHLVYARGTLRLQLGDYGDDTILVLQNAVGLTRRLFRWNTEEIIREFPIATLGCVRNGKELTVTDVYNNLIIAYLLSETRVRGLYREAERGYNDAPDRNPLYAPFTRYRKDSNIPQYWLWALSNAERIFHAIPTPANQILNYNLAQFIDLILKQGYPDRTYLEPKRDQLLSAINWDAMPKPQRYSIAAKLVKKSLSITQEPSITLLRALSDESRAMLDLRQSLRKERSQMASRHSLIVAITTNNDNRIRKLLGQRADKWLRAMRSDVATHIARRIQNIKSIEKRQQLVDAIGIFRLADDELIPELHGLHASPPRIWPDWLATREVNLIIANLLGMLCAIPVWIIGAWVVFQRRQWRIAFSSLYRIEYDRYDRLNR